MPANTSPVFPLTPIIPVGQTLNAANTAKDGTGTVATLYTAGANGSRLDGVQIAYTGSSVQTVLRLFINNGSTNATAANNSLYKSVTIPANTVSETAAAADLFVPLGYQGSGLTLPAGYKLLATLGTAPTAPIALTASGGDL